MRILRVIGRFLFGDKRLPSALSAIAVGDHIDSQIEELFKFVRDHYRLDWIGFSLSGNVEQENYYPVENIPDKNKRETIEIALSRGNKIQIISPRIIDIANVNGLYDLIKGVATAYAGFLYREKVFIGTLDSVSPIAGILSSPEEFTEEIRARIHGLRKLIEAPYVSLWLHDKGYFFDKKSKIVHRSRLVFCAKDSIDETTLSRKEIWVSDSEHPMAKAVRSRKNIETDDVCLDANYIPAVVAKTINLKGMLCCPIIGTANSCLGVINVYSHSAGKLDRNAQRMTTIFGKFIGMIIEGAILRDKADLLSSLSELMIQRPDELDATSATTLMNIIKEKLGVSAATLFLEDERMEEISVFATTGLQNDIVPIYTANEGITGAVYGQRLPVRVTNFDDLDWHNPKSRESIETPLEELIAVPVGRKGVLRCVNKISNGCFPFFTEADETVFGVLGEILDWYVKHAVLIGSYRISEEARETYLQTLRHEMISPLQHVLEDAEWAIENAEPDSDQKRTRYKRIHENIVDNINLLSLLVRGSNALDQDFDFEATDLNLTEDVFRPIVNHFQRVARRAGIKIDWDYFGLPPIRANELYSRLILYNLIRNAIKFCRTKEKSKYIRIYRGDDPSPDKVSIIVEDNGIGIETNESEMIFEKYYRGEIAKAKHITGSGLGLAIARTIARKQRGDILVTNLSNPTQIQVEFKKAD